MPPSSSTYTRMHPCVRWHGYNMISRRELPSFDLGINWVPSYTAEWHVQVLGHTSYLIGALDEFVAFIFFLPSLHHRELISSIDHVCKGEAFALYWDIALDSSKETFSWSQESPFISLTLELLPCTILILPWNEVLLSQSIFLAHYVMSSMITSTAQSVSILCILYIYELYQCVGSERDVYAMLCGCYASDEY